MLSASAEHIAYLMRPRSVAIVGMSSRSSSPSATVLNNLLSNGYDGELHLVGRSGGVVDGRQCISNMDALPLGIDLAIIMVAANAVAETIRDCVRRKVRSAICFASGFAEMGEAERLVQQEIGELAHAGEIGLVGPNCVGYINYLHGLSVVLAPVSRLLRLSRAAGPALAVIAQSGAIGVHVAESLKARSVPISYMVTTGNEAHLDTCDFLEFFTADERTACVAIYAEQIRRPDIFLTAVRTAVAVGKPVILFHPGKSERARVATASHTGSLASNYSMMRMTVERAGGLVVDTMEELIDLGELLLRFPAASTGGLGIVSGSGAMCAIAEDYCDERGISIPPLGAEQVAALGPHLPDFTPPRNPLDLGSLYAQNPDLIRLGMLAMIEDAQMGSILMAFPFGASPLDVAWMQGVVAANRGNIKPTIYAINDEGIPLREEVVRLASENRVIVSRSPERAIRALACLEYYNRRRGVGRTAHIPENFVGLPPLSRGPQPEWLGKQVMSALGISVPPGRLATSVEDATLIASKIGYPVAMKAQAAKLTHKTEAGGVLLNIVDSITLNEGWRTLHENIAHSSPTVQLDGILVESMGKPGTELVIGARRDPTWGLALMIGLGGIWVEVLSDVRFIPVDLSEHEIIDELHKLKGAKLLRGFRGSLAIDFAAVAHVASQLARLIASTPEIVEIEVNPLIAYAEGSGAQALDVLIVTRS